MIVKISFSFEKSGNIAAPALCSLGAPSLAAVPSRRGSACTPLGPTVSRLAVVLLGNCEGRAEMAGASEITQGELALLWLLITVGAPCPLCQKSPGVQNSQIPVCAQEAVWDLRCSLAWSCFLFLFFFSLVAGIALTLYNQSPLFLLFSSFHYSFRLDSKSTPSSSWINIYSFNNFWLPVLCQLHTVLRN